jgi:mevalonate kinase
MTRRGEYQKALDRYLWFHNHILEQDTGMRGVRLSFALSYWKELAKVYPPAMTALKGDRDKKTEQIITNGNPGDFFADVAAINRTLNEKNKTIELFELISNKYPAFAREIIRYILHDLLISKRYDLIKRNVVDMMEQYNRIESNYRRSFEEIGDSDKSLKSYSEDSFVHKVLELIQYCNSTGDKITAVKIRTKALALVKDSRIKRAFPDK